jgi:hypothetical protein
VCRVSSRLPFHFLKGVFLAVELLLLFSEGVFVTAENILAGFRRHVSECCLVSKVENSLSGVLCIIIVSVSEGLFVTNVLTLQVSNEVFQNVELPLNFSESFFATAELSLSASEDIFLIIELAFEFLKAGFRLLNNPQRFVEPCS